MGEVCPKLSIMHEEELDYKLLRALEENPEKSQRELAREMELSLGKVNYALKALVQRGMIKVRNFKNSKNKVAYLYKLTPSGIEQKAHLTMAFLHRKMAEYDELKKEIEDLEKEALRQKNHDAQKSAPSNTAKAH